MNVTASSPFDEIRHPKKRAFLCAFALVGTKVRAAEAENFDRTTLHTRDSLEDDAFQAALEQARVISADVLGAEAFR